MLIRINSVFPRAFAYRKLKLKLILQYLHDYLDLVKAFEFYVFFVGFRALWNLDNQNRRSRTDIFSKYKTLSLEKWSGLIRPSGK